MSGLHELQWAAVASALALGLVPAVWGDLKRCLTDKLSLDTEKGDALASGLYFTLIPFTPVSGLLVDVWGLREVLGLGALLTALGWFAVAAAGTYRGCFRAGLLTGIGLSGLNCAAVVLMPQAFIENDPPAALNLGFVFVGLGALAAPVVVAPLLRALGPRRTFTLLAVLFLIPAAAMLLVPAQALPPVNEAPEAGNLLGNPVPWLAGLAFLAYGPLENVLGQRAAAALADLGYSPRRAALLLALVWLAFLAARLMMAVFLQQDWLNAVADSWLLVLLVVWAVIVLGNLAGTHSRAGAAWGLLFVGGCLGPVFPTLVGLVFRGVEPGEYGTAYGLVYAVGTTGGLALAPLFRGPAGRGKALRGAPLIVAGAVLTAASAALALVLER
jgi:fucose permease